MFARSFSSVSRTIARRSLSTRSGPAPSSLWSSRNAVIAGTTLAITALAVTSERRKVFNESAQKATSPRDSIIAQDSLKENVHKKSVRKDEFSGESTESEASAPSDSVEKAADDAAQILEEKEAEAAEPSQGAYNPETGEINWDCPCLGGMATGPCGEQFKAAFSCFVYSEAEPKGVDCVELFKVMQDCFREHPEVYGEEIDDDEAPPAQEEKMEEKVEAAKEETAAPAAAP
ncbi:mitochondrial intermembrane space import and assembly protein 40 [Cryptococcus neoformans]|nr:mitochondrial intermembrane space import and assembly protein 40 [Cryptococcus neoformans var. grubii]